MDELIADVRAGQLSFDDAYHCWLELLRWHSVDDVLNRLPDNERASAVQAMRRDFDNDTPATQYMWFSSGRGDQPEKEEIIDKIRAWLRRPPA